MHRALRSYLFLRRLTRENLPSFAKSLTKRARLMIALAAAPSNRLDEWENVRMTRAVLSHCHSSIAPAADDNDSLEQSLAQSLNEVSDELNSACAPLSDWQNELEDTVSLSVEAKQFGHSIVDLVSDSLLHARSVTEKAALAVGSHVAELFEISRRDNELASKSLQGLLGNGGTSTSEQEAGVATMISDQRSMIDSFVNETQAGFHRQIEMSGTAVSACKEMERCVALIERLVFSSEILAFNVQVESIRLGEQGRAFSVLGEEMVRFSSKINEANQAIQSSLNSVCDLMQNFHRQSLLVEQKLTDFSGKLLDRMDSIQNRTAYLTASLNDTLCRITSSNELLMSHSQEALSELQFQDPLAQELLRNHYEIGKLKRLLDEGVCDSTSLADIDPTVGNDGSAFREAGEVLLF